ncbi:hypothetical protein BKA60DRAFT_636061 [Fusarium oxysporum]|uniref:Hydrophobin n=1 Tax=Fusarium oxysporum TaxID=5507 RepID=A0A420P7E8_FUSOX|nr:hypothetical protein BKA60DRAFT_636061 [Fusarium oxysporum]RKK88415.1 hypothetical protein BFJ69_g271 [Fusarium oxysporum]
MKASLILALPALAVAAATPHQVEERQLPTLFDPSCLLQIAGITQCLPNLSLDSIIGIVDVIGCPLRLAGQIAACLDVPGTK